MNRKHKKILTIMLTNNFKNQIVKIEPIIAWIEALVKLVEESGMPGFKKDITLWVATSLIIVVKMVFDITPSVFMLAAVYCHEVAGGERVQISKSDLTRRELYILRLADYNLMAHIPQPS